MYMRERSPKDDAFPRRRRNPSFSSSLLDSIYRSIDESNGGDGDLGYVGESNNMKKQSCSGIKGGTDVASLRRAIMIENWVEKQSVHSSMFSNSASSSSESSSGAAFSSSETDSSYKSKPRTKPKPAVSVHSENYMQFGEKPKPENGGGFTKTKLKALKIYGELKKVKQPISPGGRIASFINSIFNSGNVKKAKMCYVGAVEDVSIASEHVSKSACSSSAASTFSRSCLSKPSSRGKKLSNGAKRSVRFYPVSVILGEDSQPSSHHKSCVYEEDPSLMPKPSFQKYARTSLVKQDFTTVGQNFGRGFCDNAEDGDDESDHDGDSYSSSDLFELDHPVGVGRYREELPVYETTNFRTNQAIAKGLIL